MKGFVCIALVVFLGIVAAQGYGPKINRKPYEGGHRPFHRPFNRPPPVGPHHRPPPPNKGGYWDKSPKWGDRSDSGDSSYGSFGSDDSSGPDSSFEDSGYWHDHHHPKHPCKHPYTKKPPKPTFKTTTPTPTTTPRPTTTVSPSPKTPSTTASTTKWETTTNSVTTTEEAFTTISPKTQKCIDRCLSTPEYNPVCGSNGLTYDNEGKLFCAASCGVNVTLRRRSVCPPPNWDYDDEDETTGTATAPPPTTTTTPYIGRTTSMTNLQRCMKQCHASALFKPVCGSDFATYMNIDRLKCAQSCGEVVEVLCEKPCAACGITPVTPKTTTTTLRTTTTPQIGRTTQKPDIEKCIKDCPVTPEYNPVCGSNGYTYSNPGRLLCSQLCGLDVRAVRSGPCGSRTTSTTTTQAPPTPTTRSPAVLSCIRRCPVTSEYNPVCGSDGLTYTNPGNLECAKFCGVAVAFKHKSRCVDEPDIGPDESTTLQTTREINENKEPATTPSTTMKPTTPTTTPTSTKNPDPNSSSTLGFTIPDDVLDNIFGSTTTQVPITKPTNPDDDEDLDLDTRFSTLKNRTEIVKV